MTTPILTSSSSSSTSSHTGPILRHAHALGSDADGDREAKEVETVTDNNLLRPLVNYRKPFFPQKFHPFFGASNSAPYKKVKVKDNEIFEKYTQPADHKIKKEHVLQAAKDVIENWKEGKNNL